MYCIYSVLYIVYISNIIYGVIYIYIIVCNGHLIQYMSMQCRRYLVRLYVIIKLRI